ncbi:MAG: MarR family transcriptional regulator [Acidobacteria bacterium]|nr:MarR family transcriptional regulator [Acidobacteriota bacterium]
MKAPHESLEPALEFLRLLWGIEHVLQSASKRMRRRIGITGPQRLVLKIVSQFPGISAGELARVVQLHPSTLTGVIQRLVDKRLLRRERDQRDTRVVRLQVSRGAKRFTSRSRGTIEGTVAAALDRLPPGDLSRARRVLRAVAESLDPAANGSGPFRRRRSSPRATGARGGSAVSGVRSSPSAR